MTVNTKEPDKKKANLAKIREFHRETLDKKGVINPYIVGKMAYRPTGKVETVIGLFKTEVSVGSDIYIELTNRDFEPEDPQRCLYKWKYNPHYEAEYDKKDPVPGVSDIYLIPLAELELIRNYGNEPKEENPHCDIMSPIKDIPMSDMTMNDYVAIHMGIPVSNKQWLNDIITKKTK